jgi:PTH2 family peptidyl-tRNA hydrolase
MYKQVIIVRKDLNLGKGKIAAQVAHGAVSAYILSCKKEPKYVDAWIKEGQKKIVLKIDSKKELLELYNKVKKKYVCSLIKDAGLTQLSKADITCLAIGPIPENKIDVFTSKYKLL